MANYCPNCRTALDPAWNACPQCGQGLRAARTRQTSPRWGLLILLGIVIWIANATGSHTATTTTAIPDTATAPTPSERPIFPTSVTMGMEVVYRAGVGRTTARLVADISTFSDVIAARNLQSTVWRARMADAIAAISADCDEVARLDAPPRYAAADNQYQLGARRIHSSMTTLTRGLAQNDAATIEEATTEMHAGQGALHDAAVLYRAIDP